MQYRDLSWTSLLYGCERSAIAVALFAAFVVGGIIAKAVPLWLVAVLGLVVGGAVFVFVDRYPRLPRVR